MPASRRPPGFNQLEPNRLQLGGICPAPHAQVPAFGGQSLFGAFTNSIGAELSHFPTVSGLACTLCSARKGSRRACARAACALSAFVRVGDEMGHCRLLVVAPSRLQGRRSWAERLCHWPTAPPPPPSCDACRALPSPATSGS